MLMSIPDGVFVASAIDLSESKKISGSGTPANLSAANRDNTSTSARTDASRFEGGANASRSDDGVESHAQKLAAPTHNRIPIRKNTSIRWPMSIRATPEHIRFSVFLGSVSKYPDIPAQERRAKSMEKNKSLQIRHAPELLRPTSDTISFAEVAIPSNSRTDRGQPSYRPLVSSHP